LTVKAASAASAVGLHARQQHQAAAAFDEHAHRGLVARALDEIAFPVAWHDAVVDFRRTHMDADHLGELASPVSISAARHASALALTKADDSSRRSSPRACASMAV
jgi:hypothetical protein